jgi:hypothetical protein
MLEENVRRAMCWHVRAEEAITNARKNVADVADDGRMCVAVIVINSSEVFGLFRV